MGRRLYVGNLPYSATDEDLTELFGRAGDVANVHVMRDQATGRARGFAFVEMAPTKGTEGHRDSTSPMDGRAGLNEARPIRALAGSWRALVDGRGGGGSRRGGVAAAGAKRGSSGECCGDPGNLSHVAITIRSEGQFLSAGSRCGEDAASTPIVSSVEITRRSTHAHIKIVGLGRRCRASASPSTSPHHPRQTPEAVATQWILVTTPRELGPQLGAPLQPRPIQGRSRALRRPWPVPDGVPAAFEFRHDSSRRLVYAVCGPAFRAVRGRHRGAHRAGRATADSPIGAFGLGYYELRQDVDSLAQISRPAAVTCSLLQAESQQGCGLGQPDELPRRLKRALPLRRARSAASMSPSPGLGPIAIAAGWRGR